jgi:hypothetical protein
MTAQRGSTIGSCLKDQLDIRSRFCRNGQTGVKFGGILRQYGYSGSGASMLPL